MFNNLTGPLIMGILNVTPDSFSDGGKFTAIDSALLQAQFMISAGVDIIDIGGESTRPGSESVSAEKQISRVIPVVKAIRKDLSATLPISIDTTLSEVARAALDAGATIINDISAGEQDAEILSLAAKRNVPIILMHIRGQPDNMQEAPFYQDVVAEVLNSLQERVDVALAAGIDKNQIAIDPGIGFGKRRQDNLDLLANLDRFVATGYPVLLGTSRKRFMGSLCAVTEPAELVSATAATTALGVQQGVQMFRVHDVKENRQAADVAWAIKERGFNNT
ncbi:dihydropteroate synthase [Bathymodiolus platifrons methanotrophic gill symbiont]|uniref:dihydropteroate synthase n=1 Tax=Bathymodiolus platifrons methanotrophic gill symbiont TaxID=113268 RepID=UPI000B41B3D1|nr:dihydropteroate synthase [Bathymodiolus platifrons methanotrophic gill symbiont]TXK96421.1 dihydropteroate synthase [Methylococcaceae bacterium CS4]TXK96919.1 dihydropteroate synthase [Methylococcaceae bacterium HT1]TXL14137.1 dihydropteroate synthase [Methylococcaceae bacterium HT4]TXL15191.1 dihydropteroate synthase [Methylococcaceae bacterium HT3]TXL20056.1 dihydropteroate synthase [Methylococcaceae bacterium HT5]TXL22335.1 dihydropteroate synthase [Methylococcaceae bacterium HT2]